MIGCVVAWLSWVTLVKWIRAELHDCSRASSLVDGQPVSMTGDLKTEFTRRKVYLQSRTTRPDQTRKIPESTRPWPLGAKSKVSGVNPRSTDPYWVTQSERIREGNVSK